MHFKYSIIIWSLNIREALEMQVLSYKNIDITTFKQNKKVKNNREKFNNKQTYNYPKGLCASNDGILLKQANKTSFKGRELRKASDVEKLLNDMGIKSSFKESDFVADCSYKMVKVFEQYFGKKSLPKEINFLSFKESAPGKNTDSTLGWFKLWNHAVEINKDQDCYESKAKLKIQSLSDRYGSIFSGGSPFNSTSSYLSTFAHEMGHCAHYQRILDTSRTSSFANKCWDALYNKTVPKGIGKIMTKWKLGCYATGEYGGGLCEHMANRIARDVCNNYDSYYELYEGYEDDLKYADIFDRKWGKLDPVHPQSYLDFYDQQIWNAGVGGYIGEDGEYHNLKIKEAEDKINEFIEMAEKIARKEDIKVEDVDLYKVKEFLNNPQKAKEYFEPSRTYEMRHTINGVNNPYEFNPKEHLINTGRILVSGVNDLLEHPVRNIAACVTGIDRLGKHPNTEKVVREIYHLEGTVSEPAGEIEQKTSFFDNVASLFSGKSARQHQQERQKQHMLF